MASEDPLFPRSWQLRHPPRDHRPPRCRLQQWRSELPSGEHLGACTFSTIVADITQCVNIQVTSGGSTSPSGVPATSFYKATDPGILIDIYSAISSYTIPGPALSGLKRRAAHARDWLLSA